MTNTPEVKRRLYSLKEVAKELGGISICFLQKAIAQKKIRVTRLGRRVFVTPEECNRIQREGLPSVNA
jgi:hypothetical protein